MKEEWCRIFDEQYVEDELIARLIRNIPEMSEVIERLRELAATREADDVASEEGNKKKERTIVEPFNLSKPKPRTIPEPFAIKIENPYKKKVPKSVHDPDGDGTLRRVEEARVKAKEAAVKRSLRARSPDLAVSKLPGQKVRMHLYLNKVLLHTHAHTRFVCEVAYAMCARTHARTHKHLCP